MWPGLWPEGLADCFPKQSAEEHVCRIVYICQLKSTCSVSSQGLLTMPLTFSLTPTVFQVAERSNSQSWSPGDAGYVPWLTLPSPNLWQAQGPLHPCDTLLPKLNPLLFFLVCDVITLGTGTARRTPILFSFPAIKYYVRADFSSSSPKCVWRFWGQHGYSSALFPAEDVMIKVCVPQA